MIFDKFDTGLDFVVISFSVTIYAETSRLQAVINLVLLFQVPHLGKKYTQSIKKSNSTTQEIYYLALALMGTYVSTLYVVAAWCFVTYLLRI